MYDNHLCSINNHKYDGVVEFRLVNGRNSKEGRIEVYHSGQWGTICDDKFGANEGGMICRALGFE